MVICPLCNIKIINSPIIIDEVVYNLCNNCNLIFKDKKHFLASNEERRRYLFHENSIENQGYVNFLTRIINPTIKLLKPGDCGLDFGCGPNSVLSQLMKLKNFCCDFYDPFFYPELKNFKYDFIFATECFEHFHNPRKELITLCSLLKNEGFLSIMTEIYKNIENFRDWYYHRDPTHVCFFSTATFDYICDEFKFKLIYSDSLRVFILKKL